MKLDTNRIRQELNEKNKNQKWLAEQLRISEPRLTYALKHKLIKYAAPIASIFHLSGKDFIIE